MTTEERKAEDARFRQEYPLFAQYPELIYLDNAATTQKPSCVIQAESAFYEKYNANPFRGVYELAEFATEHYEEARAEVAKLLHANRFYQKCIRESEFDCVQFRKSCASSW